MLLASKAFQLSSNAEPLLPQPESLAPLWEAGIKPRQGQLIMVAGRSGSQKSGFALFWVAEMGLSTLYLSGDSTPFEMTARLASMASGETIEEIESELAYAGPERYASLIEQMDITFCFRSPITWLEIDRQLDAYVELHNRYPEVVVVDNFMDIEYCDSDYQAQMDAMQNLTSICRDTGVTMIVLHHATDKTGTADQLPGLPPPRAQIKGGLSEKPQLILTVALWSDPLSGMPPELRVAAVKQRSGFSDPAAKNPVTLIADPERTRFRPPAVAR